MSGITFEPVDGFSPNLHRYIIVTSLRTDYILVTLTSFKGHNHVSGISIEPVDGFPPNLQRYIIVTSLRADYTLVTWI